MERTPMPMSRRRRANPPEQPDGNNHFADQPENATDAFAAEQSVESSQRVERQEQNQAVHNQPDPAITPQASFHPFGPGQSSPALHASSPIAGYQASQIPPYSLVSQWSHFV